MEKNLGNRAIIYGKIGLMLSGMILANLLLLK